MAHTHLYPYPWHFPLLPLIRVGTEQTTCRIESVEKLISQVCRVYMHISKISQAKPCYFCSKKIWEDHTTILQLLIWFLCHLESVCAAPISRRDIVDTLCHASRRSDTTRPNKAGFLLHEGRVRRAGRHEATIQSHLSLVGSWTSIGCGFHQSVEICTKSLEMAEVWNVADHLVSLSSTLCHE
jgi:hypothetical protein